jgi:hypothetical protein
MRTKAKGPAFPLISDEGYIINAGLTKREYFAAMALQGLLTDNESPNSREEFAGYAVKFADALIEELSKTKTNEKK